MYLLTLMAVGFGIFISMNTFGNSLANDKSTTLTNSLSTVFAQNFIKYREEVDKLAESNISYNGTWPSASILSELPGMTNNSIQYFGNYQTNNVLYTWILSQNIGYSVTQNSIGSEIYKASNGSALVGLDSGGVFKQVNGTIPIGNGGFVLSSFMNQALPGNIPNGSVVSVQPLTSGTTWPGP